MESLNIPRPMSHDIAAKERIMKAALGIFAERGYEGASIQDIVEGSRVTKPTLYYHFGSKEGLYQSLVDWAHDRRFELMREAVARHTRLEDQLVELLDVLFAFARDHRDITRLCFASVFAARGETPIAPSCMEKRERNMAFIRDLIENGIKSGELDARFATEELVTAIFSQIIFHAMMQVVEPEHAMKRPRARHIVKLFFDGARATSNRTERTEKS
jgi:AcrR family transcriptional regulator